MVERKKTNLRKARAAVRIFHTCHRRATLTVCIENLGQAVEYTTTSLLLSYLPNINERSSSLEVQFVGVEYRRTFSSSCDATVENKK